MDNFPGRRFMLPSHAQALLASSVSGDAAKHFTERDFLWCWTNIQMPSFRLAGCHLDQNRSAQASGDICDA